MPAMAIAMAIVPSPLSAGSNQVIETLSLPPLQSLASCTNTDNFSSWSRKRAFHSAGGVFFSRRKHQRHLEEAIYPGVLQETDCCTDNCSLPQNTTEGTPAREGDATAAPLSCAGKQEGPQACLEEEFFDRQNIMEHLSRSTFNLEEGMLFHSLLIESGLQLKTFEENILMHMYGNFGALEDACFIFRHMQQLSVVSWNTLMSAYMHQKYFAEVLELLTNMHQEGFLPDSVTITIALRSCAGLAAFSKGRLIHYLVVVDGLEAEINIGTSLILMYAKCGAWREARFVFDNMPDRVDFTWVAIILACCDNGRDYETLQLYRQMQQEGRVPNKVILLSALKSCTNLLDLTQGKLIHKCVIESAFASDEELGSVLVAMYGQCGAMDLACAVFESMQTRTVASYNALMAAYMSQKLHRKAFQLVQRMLADGLIPDAATYSKAVQASESYAALEDVHELHSLVIMLGLDSENMMGTALVKMYCKFGKITEAFLILSQSKEYDVFTWNALLAACAQMQRPYESIEIFERMLQEGINPNKESFFSGLSSCAHLGALEKGKVIHTCILEADLDVDAGMGSSLINMYGKCGALDDARSILDNLTERNVIHWTSMIAVYVRHGRAKDALQLFDKMQQERVKPNSITFTNVLNACASLGALTEGQMIHVCIKDSELKVDSGLANALLHMYCKCGSLTDARLVFEDMSHKKTVSWNVLITAYIQQNQHEVAVQLFRRMQQEMVEADEITYVNILRACACLKELCFGKEIHSCVVQKGLGSGIIFATSLVSMYGACGALEESHWVFNEIQEHNVVSWTSIISVYVQQGLGEEAIQLFLQMRAEGWEPDALTLVSVLGAYASLKLAAPDDVVQACFKCNFRSDVLLGNALINMYAKCGAIRSAISIFEKMHEHSVVSYNTMISAYGQQGYGKEALGLLQRARQERISPDELTWSHCLSICADLGSLGQGKLIHRGIIACGYEVNVGLGNALVSMYGKCGAMEEAVFVFNNIQRDVVSWNAILATLSQHGHVEKAVQLFRKMLGEGIKPDEVTFLSVLNACSHAGLVEDGCDFFLWMRDSHKTVLTISHYGCLVDLFGKSGHLEVAEDLLCTVPVYTTALLWITLLSSCRNYGDVERGERALDYVAHLDPGNAAPYVLMSNIYATHGRWDEVKMLREVMLKKGIQKRPGCSKIEVDNKVHSFLPSDKRHPDRHAIYKKLEILNQKLEDQGYVPDTRLALQDVDEESKKYLLCHHSERLALAFGLIRTPDKEPLLIVKNLRMCADCHAAFKFLSTIVDRKITVRDASRFHCFSKGLCSCGDYW